VTSVEIRRGSCDDNRDFKLVIRKANSIKPIDVSIGEKGYDDEENHEFLREELHADIIPARYQDFQVWRTRGRYRKEMKRGYTPRRSITGGRRTRLSSQSSRGPWVMR